MLGAKENKARHPKKILCVYFLLLATMLGCTKTSQSSENLFNSKINTTLTTEVPIDKLTDFEWSSVCVLPQYVRFSDLAKKYPFLKKSEGADFILSHDDELYVEQKKPLLLFFNNKLNQYTSIKIFEDSVRNGMEWYLEFEPSKIRKLKYSNLLPDSELIQNECLHYTDSPTVKFVAISGSTTDVSKTYHYLIMSKGK